MPRKRAIWRSDGHGARQSQMETSNSSLIFIFLMEESERKELRLS